MGLLDRYQAIVAREEGTPQGHIDPTQANARPASKTNRQMAFEYYYGANGCPTDYAKAFEYVKKAIEENPDDRSSLFIIGDMCYFGRYVPQNYMEAKMWFEKAAALGDSFAQFRMFDIYYYGRLGAKNIALAYDYLRKSLVDATESELRWWVSIYDTGHTAMVVSYHAFEAGLRYAGLFHDTAVKIHKEYYGTAGMARLCSAVLGYELAQNQLVNYANSYTGNEPQDYLARRDYAGWALVVGALDKRKATPAKCMAYGFGIGVPQDLALVEKWAKGFLAEKEIKDMYEMAKKGVDAMPIDEVLIVAREEVLEKRYEEALKFIRGIWGDPDDNGHVDRNAYYLYQLSLTHPEIKECILRTNPFATCFERNAEK